MYINVKYTELSMALNFDIVISDNEFQSKLVVNNHYYDTRSKILHIVHRFIYIIVFIKTITLYFFINNDYL